MSGRRTAPHPPPPAPPSVAVPVRINDDGGQTPEQERNAAAIVVYFDISPGVASAVVNIDAFLFAIAPVVPVVSGGRAPLPDVVVVCVVLRTAVVNGTPASDPLAVAFVVADVFLMGYGANLVLLGSRTASVVPPPTPSRRRCHSSHGGGRGGGEGVWWWWRRDDDYDDYDDYDGHGDGDG